MQDIKGGESLESREMKLLATKGGSGSSTFRVTLPTTWVREMGLNEDKRDLNLYFNGSEIIIRNKKELESMKLNIKLMVDEGIVNLELEGKLLSFKEREFKGEELKVSGHDIRTIDENNIVERDENWEVTKKNGEKFKYEVRKRETTYKNKVKKETFEDFFSDKIVYENWGIDELKEYGEINMLR